jgi:outer membrane protein
VSIASDDCRLPISIVDCGLPIVIDDCRCAIRCLLLASLLVAVPPASASAQPGALPLTLDDALARGQEHSLRIVELQARVDAAAAIESGRSAADRPLVAALGGYTRTNHVDEFVIAAPGQVIRTLYPDVPDNYRARLDLQWPIYSGGRSDALVRAARAEREAAGADLLAARADLRLEIARAFWALVTAREAEQVLEQSVESLEAHVRDMRVRLDQGLVPPNEVLSAEAQRSRQRVLALEAKNTRASVEADLRRLIGDDGSAPIIPQAPSTEAVIMPSEPAALLEEARHLRPERQAFQERAAASRAREEAAAAGARPQLGIAGGYDYARPNPRIFPRADTWEDSWDISVNVSWSLWDGGRRHAERAEAAAGTRALEARAGEFDRQLALEIRQRWLDLDSSRAAIDAAADGVRAAVEARRVLRERFAAGVATSTEVLDAETAVLQAELDRTRAVSNARLARARLDRAVGR